jgi:hypothetical protein
MRRHAGKGAINHALANTSAHPRCCLCVIINVFRSKRHLCVIARLVWKTAQLGRKGDFTSSSMVRFASSCITFRWISVLRPASRFGLVSRCEVNRYATLSLGYTIFSSSLTASGTKRAPNALEFDANDALHREFAFAATKLRAHLYGLRLQVCEAYFGRVLHAHG